MNVEPSGHTRCPAAVVFAPETPSNFRVCPRAAHAMYHVKKKVMFRSNFVAELLLNNTSSSAAHPDLQKNHCVFEGGLSLLTCHLKIRHVHHMHKARHADNTQFQIIVAGVWKCCHIRKQELHVHGLASLEVREYTSWQFRSTLESRILSVMKILD